MMNTEKQQLNTINQEVSHDEVIVESSLTETAATQLASNVIADLRTGLEKSEEKAIDVSTVIQQVVILSDRDQYQKAMDAIFNDPTLSTEQKLRLKAEEDARQDSKDQKAAECVKELQSSQTMAIVEIIKAYGGIICFGIGGVSVPLLCGTATGRVILNKALSLAIKQGPRLARKVAV